MISIPLSSISDVDYDADGLVTEQASASRSAHFAMTFRQEVANAISMCLPAVCAVCYMCYEGSVGGFIILMGILIHLPVSFTYHMGCAFQRYADRLDNDMRRLDQSLQHVVATLFVFALSNSSLYVALNVAWNTVCVVLLWREDTSNDGKRWIFSCVSCIFFCGSLLIRGEYDVFAKLICTLLLGGLFFVPQININVFGGWGHCVFHIVLCAVAVILVDSAGRSDFGRLCR